MPANQVLSCIVYGLSMRHGQSQHKVNNASNWHNYKFVPESLISAFSWSPCSVTEAISLSYIVVVEAAPCLSPLGHSCLHLSQVNYLETGVVYNHLESAKKVTCYAKALLFLICQ